MEYRSFYYFIVSSFNSCNLSLFDTFNTQIKIIDKAIVKPQNSSLIKNRETLRCQLEQKRYM